MSTIHSITYEDCVNITPSDTATFKAAGFGADVAGTITITTIRNTKVQRTILAGIIYPIAITQIWATGTAASGTFAVMVTPYAGNLNPGSGTVLP